MNLLQGHYENGSVLVAGHRFKAELQTAAAREVIVGIRPGALRIGPGGLQARVDLIEDLGDTAVLDLDCAVTPVRLRISDDSIPREGETISINARPQDIHLFDPATRQRM